MRYKCRVCLLLLHQRSKSGPLEVWSECVEGAAFVSGHSAEIEISLATTLGPMPLSTLTSFLLSYESRQIFSSRGKLDERAVPALHGLPSVTAWNIVLHVHGCTCELITSLVALAVTCSRGTRRASADRCPCRCLLQVDGARR